MPVGEEVLDERAVGAGHARVVDGEAVREQVGEVLVLGRLGLRLQDLARGAVLLQRVAEGVSRSSAMSRMARAVLAHSLRECTKTSTWFLPACSCVLS